MCPSPPWPLNAACSHLSCVSSRECYCKYFSRIILLPGPSCLGLLLLALGFPGFLLQFPDPTSGPLPYLGDTSRQSLGPLPTPHEPLFHSGTLGPSVRGCKRDGASSGYNLTPFYHHHLLACLQSTFHVRQSTIVLTNREEGSQPSSSV